MGHETAARKLASLTNASQNGNGWKGLCPVHGDHKPSLSIFRGDDSEWHFECASHGCNGFLILDAVGMSFGEWKTGEPREASTRDGWGTLVAEYPYRDAAGNLLYTVCRFETGGKKTFKQRAADGTWKTRGIPKVLFRLPELLDATPDAFVYVTEGEKAAMAVVSLGLTATTACEGAGKWSNRRDHREVGYADSLAGRHVVLFPDNDDVGRQHMADVAACLAGKAATVRILSLPGLPPKGDAVEWISFGGTRDELERLARATDPITATPSPTSTAVTSTSPLDPLHIALPEGRTDLSNARRLVKLHGSDMRFCHPWGQWLVYDGTRWKSDASGAAIQKAGSVSDRNWVDARASTALADIDALLRFAAASASSRAINAMLTLATAEPGIPVLPADLDRDPFLFNAANGTIDLRTGKLRPHSRDDLLSKLSPIPFDPKAECPTWLDFLFKIFDGDFGLIRFIRRLTGYSLTGNVSEQILPILWGSGANGKSTFMSAVMQVLGGDYSMQAPPDLLMTKNGREHPTELADLFGKRLVAAIESGEGSTLDESLVKQLTGGDTIRARRCYEDFWQFDPTHKLFLATNHKPTIKGTDWAIWRRVRLIPFAVTFWDPDKGEAGPEHLRQDKQLAAKLRTEASGILAWMVQGCIDWQADGLSAPPTVQAETATYREDQDQVRKFVSEMCELGADKEVQASRLYERFKNWGGRMSQTAFGKRMEAIGYDKRKSSAVFYVGIGLPGMHLNANTVNEVLV